MSELTGSIHRCHAQFKCAQTVVGVLLEMDPTVCPTTTKASGRHFAGSGPISPSRELLLLELLLEKGYCLKQLTATVNYLFNNGVNPSTRLPSIVYSTTEILSIRQRRQSTRQLRITVPYAPTRQLSSLTVHSTTVIICFVDNRVIHGLHDLL